jgi:hypothetical protein
MATLSLSNVLLNQEREREMKTKRIVTILAMCLVAVAAGFASNPNMGINIDD